MKNSHLQESSDANEKAKTEDEVEEEEQEEQEEEPKEIPDNIPNRPYFQRIEEEREEKIKKELDEKFARILSGEGNFFSWIVFWGTINTSSINIKI